MPATALRSCSLVVLSARAAVVAAIAGLWLQQAAASEPAGDGAFIMQDVRYIWPVHVWSVPLTAPIGGQGQLEHPEITDTLASIGERKFEWYKREVLPLELEADPVFAAEFAQLDGSRTNLAFQRWQKRVFAKLKRVPLEELSWDGKPIPRYKNVSYEWPEFYEAREYKLLRRQISKMAGQYLNSMGREAIHLSAVHGNPYKARDDERHKFRILTWVEVYRHADSQKPHSKTGAPVVGTIFARYSMQHGVGAQKLNFEDPRGINPPFGRTHSHQPRQGEMLMYPSWSSIFITPNPVNRSNVFINFVCWPSAGAQDFDWEDDATGDYIYRKQFNIKRPRKKKKTDQQAPPRTEL